MHAITWWPKTIVSMAVYILVVGLSMGAVDAVPSVEISRLTLGNDPNRFIEWNVTDDVRAFLDDGVANYGWLIKDRNEDDAVAYRTDWSSKDSTSLVCGGPSAPQLLIETSAGVFLVEVPVIDASLDENSPNTNRGAAPLLRVISRAPQRNWRSVLRFELPLIPPGATMRATLRLCQDKISGDNSRRVYEAHRLTIAWEEAEVTARWARDGVPWDFGFE